MHAFTEVAAAGLTGRRPPSPTTVLGDCWQWTEGDAMLVSGGEVGKQVRRSQKKDSQEDSQLAEACRIHSSLVPA